MAQELQSSAHIAHANQCPSTRIQATAQLITWLQGERVGDKAWQQAFALQFAYVPPKPPQVAPTTAEHYLHKQIPNTAPVVPDDLVSDSVNNLWTYVHIFSILNNMSKKCLENVNRYQNRASWSDLR